MQFNKSISVILLKKLFVVLLLLTPLINFNYFDGRFLELGEFYFYGLVGLGSMVLCLVVICNKDRVKYCIGTIDIIVFLTTLFIIGKFLSTDIFSLSSHLFLRVLFSILLFLILKSINFKNQELAIIIAYALSVIGIILALHALLQFFNIISKQGYFDIISVFLNPSILTNYFCVVLPISLATFYKSESTGFNGPIFKYVNITSFVLMTIVIFLSTERTGLVAVTLGIGAVILLKNKNLTNKLKRSCRNPILLTLFVFVVLISSFILYSIRTESVAGRIFIYKNTLNIIGDHILSGVGYGKFKAVYNVYQSQYFRINDGDDLSRTVADNIYYPFNEYLGIAAELGMFGLLALSLILFKTIGHTLFTSTNKSFLFIGSTGSFLAILICALFSYPLKEISISITVLLVFSILIAEQRVVFTFYVKPLYVKLTSSIVIVILVYILFLVTTLFLNQKKWGQTAYLAQNGQFSDDSYKDLYPVLKGNGNFLYNYGVELLLNEQYEESVQILEEASLFFTNTDLIVYLADGYKALKNYKRAEDLYHLAVNMVPKKFIPKYALLEFYEETGCCEKARFWAKRILQSEIQVFSEEIRLIRTHALKTSDMKCN